MEWPASTLLVEEFGYEDFVFNHIRQLSYSDYDDEALKETSAFVSIPWVDVTPAMLRKNFSVFSFFSDFAFFVFTPALIKCSLENASMVHLSVEVFLNCLKHQDLHTLNALNDERWRQFSKRQLEIIVSWIKYSGGDFLRFFDHEEIQESLLYLDALIHQAAEIEERWLAIKGSI